MEKTGTHIVTPMPRDSEVNMPLKPWVESFTPGTLNVPSRVFPNRARTNLWQNTQDVGVDMKDLAAARLEDGVLRFTQAETFAPLRRLIS